jgi:hypothetical protein
MGIFIQATAVVVHPVGPDTEPSFTTAKLHCVLADTESRCQLIQCEIPQGAKPLQAAWKLIGTADHGDPPAIERLAHARDDLSRVQDRRGLFVGVVVQQPIDLIDHVDGKLPELP